MSEHTPGPWIKDYGGTRGHIKSVWEGHKEVPAGRCTPTVCKYEMHETIIPLEQQEANAHLITSAPDLLAALEWCAGLAYAGGKRVGDVELVKSALAKARGDK